MYEGFTFDGADETFLKAARRLEDAVTVHINSGGWITSGPKDNGDPDCRCPVGCVDPNGARFPFCDAPGLLGVDAESALDFVNVFDGVRVDPLGPYGRLGLAYRRRFVEGVK